MVFSQENSHHHNKDHGHGYGSMDSRYFLHGTRRNEITGGTCEEFIRINAIKKCCANRDDDCYMIHYDSRCYCDLFCDRSKQNDHSDCCPDAGDICSSSPPVHTQPPPAPVPETTESKSLFVSFLFL